MKHNPDSFFNLYHGTTRDSIIEILENEVFHIIPRKDHWLGDGIYFFVDDIGKAIWWSEMTARRFKKSSGDTGVIFVEAYKIKKEKLLNLDSETDRKKVANFIKNSPKSFTMNLTSDGEEQRKMEARAKLINIIVDYYDMVAVKGTFHKDHPKKLSFLDDLGLSNNEVQFCIIDTDTINFDQVKDITQEVI